MDGSGVIIESEERNSEGFRRESLVERSYFL